MADKTVNIWVKVKGNAEKALKSVNKQLGDTEKQGNKTALSFKKLAVAGGSLVVFNKASKWLKESVRMAQEQEKAYTRMSTIARTVTKATEEQIKSITDLSQAMQAQTTVADDVILAGQSQLLSFGVTAKEAENLTESLLNLTVANDGIAPTQESAINSANMLGKALTGQAGALSRAGVLLDEHQKKLIQEGDQATRVATIIGVMEQNYGGLAKAMAETSAGQLQQMENSISDIREEVGERLAPAFIDVKKAVYGAYQFVLDNEGVVLSSVQNLTKAVDIALTGFSNLFGEQEMDAEAVTAQFDIVTGRLNKARSEIKKIGEQIAFESAGLEEYGENFGFSEAKIESLIQKQMRWMVEQDKAIAEQKRLNDTQNKVAASITATSGKIKDNTIVLDDNTESLNKNSNALELFAQYHNAIGPEPPEWMTGGGLTAQILDTSELEDDASKKEQIVQTSFDTMQQLANGAMQVLSTVNNRRQQEYDNEVQRQKDEVKNSSMSAKQKAKALQKIEEDSAKKRHEMRLKEWRQSLIMSLVNTALGVTKSIATLGMPAAIPAIIATGIAGGISTGIIAANKPKAYNGRDPLVSNPQGLKGDVNEYLVRDDEEILPPSHPRHKNNAGAGGNTLSIGGNTLVIEGNATDEQLNRAEAILSEDRTRTAQMIESFFTNGEINPTIINEALAL